MPDNRSTDEFGRLLDDMPDNPKDEKKLHELGYYKPKDMVVDTSRIMMAISERVQLTPEQYQEISGFLKIYNPIKLKESEVM